MGPTYSDRLGYATVQTGNWLPTFRKNILPQHKKYCMTVTPPSKKTAGFFETSVGLSTCISVQCNYFRETQNGSYTRHKPSSAVTATTHCRILFYHSSGYAGSNPLGYDTLQMGIYLPTLRRNLLSPSSGQSKKETRMVFKSTRMTSYRIIITDVSDFESASS